MDGNFSGIAGILSRDRGERRRELSCCAGDVKCSFGLPSGDGDEIAGNLKVCGNDPDPFRLANGAPGRFGVLGAVVTPG